MRYDRAKWHAMHMAAGLSAVFLALTAMWGDGLGAAAAQSTNTTRPAVEFQRDIQPILAARCESCHGPEKQRGGLRLDSHDAVLKGGTDGPVVTAGDSAKSLLIQLVTGQDPDRPMPPKGDRLTREQIDLLKAWIEAGARGTGESPASQPAAQANSSAAPVDPTLEWATSDAGQQFVLRRRERLKKLPAPTSPPNVSSEVFNDIDRFIVGKWQEAKLPQAAASPSLCSDATYLRRVYLDVIGRVPTLAEAREFLDSADKEKRNKLVDALLARNDEYAAHWTPFWEEALTSSPYTVVGGIPSRGDHQKWIYESFRQNKPYDVMVAELLDPRMPDHREVKLQDIYGKPIQIGYVLNITHEYTIQTAANVGQVFLGTGMKCASCHSHFENTEWPQQRFLSFASLFNPNDLEVIRCEKKSGKFAPAKYAFDIPGLPEKVPANLDGRLHYLTLAMVDPLNPRFAPAIVNRLWKRYIGLGLFEPADDFRLEYPATHPELLAWLAHDFMTHDYDLKRTIRQILTSRTYQLEHNPALEDHFDVAKRKDMRYYRSPSLRRLTAEEAIDSIHAIKDQSLPADGRLYHRIEATALTKALGRPVSRNEVSTCRSDDVAVVQSLELLNGREFYDLVYSSDRLGTIVNDLPVDGKIETLFLAVYGRSPNEAERKSVTDFLTSDGGESASSRRQDVVWLDDQLPAGARADGTNGPDSWQWFNSNHNPVFSRDKSHTQNMKGKHPKQVQHHFTQAAPLTVRQDGVLYCYVYIDPQSAPAEIMLQWNDGTWDHRAFWGKDLIAFGTLDTPSRVAMGALPELGKWTRLEVPAAKVGFKAGSQITGMSFDQHGAGKVFWDQAGITQQDEIHPALRDVLWAMLAGPEFEYIY